MQPDIEIIEIGPREGLQYHKKYVPADEKIALVNMLFDCGFGKVEVTSFVHPKAAPQMKDAVEVLSGIRRRGREGQQRVCRALVPNETGCRSAIACKADEMAVWIFLTDRLSYSTLNRSISEQLKRISTICEIARENGVKVSAYIGAAFGYPGEDPSHYENLYAMVAKLVQLGCYPVCLNDEFAMVTPVTVRQHLRMCMEEVEASKLAVHFYENRGMGLANVLAAYESGIRVFNSSLGGAGVHSYLRGAIPGKSLGKSEPHGLATEDLVYGFEEMGIATGIDIDCLINCGRFLERVMGVRLHSRIRSSGLSGDTLSEAKINLANCNNESSAARANPAGLQTIPPEAEINI
jgi:hydroxymethylglutaryl-CoA lyase